MHTKEGWFLLLQRGYISFSHSWFPTWNEGKAVHMQTTMVVGGIYGWYYKKLKGCFLSRNPVQSKQTRDKFPTRFFVSCLFCFLLSIQFSAYCRGRCRPLNISMDDAKNRPVNFRLTELWRRCTSLYDFHSNFSTPSVSCPCVTSLWWMDWFNYSRMLKECVCVFSNAGLRI